MFSIIFHKKDNRIYERPIRSELNDRKSLSHEMFDILKEKTIHQECIKF